MNLKCDNCHKCFQVNGEDINRINKALNKGLNMIFIHCSECNKRTTWFPTIEECTDNISHNIIEDLSRNEIPKGYINFLKNHHKKQIKIFDDEDDFKLYSYDELQKMVNIDGEMYYQMSEILGYVKTIAKVALEDIEENVKLLENSISIGYENTRILFIDSREENSFLYIFHPDGGDVEKTSLRIKDLGKG